MFINGRIFLQIEAEANGIRYTKLIQVKPKNFGLCEIIHICKMCENNRIAIQDFDFENVPYFRGERRPAVEVTEIEFTLPEEVEEEIQETYGVILSRIEIAYQRYLALRSYVRTRFV